MKVLAFIFKTLYMVTLGRGYLSRYPRKHRDGLLTISYCIYWVLSSRMKLCDMGTRSEVVLFRLDSLLPQYLLAPSIDICQALGWAPRAWFRWREEPTAERGSQRHRGGRRGGGGGAWGACGTLVSQGWCRAAIPDISVPKPHVFPGSSQGFLSTHFSFRKVKNGGWPASASLGGKEHELLHLWELRCRKPSLAVPGCFPFTPTTGSSYSYRPLFQ